MRGLVLPVHGPGRWIEWHHDGDLLALLYREIGTDCVDSVELRGIGDGGLTLWVDDTGLLHDEPAYNDVALVLARASGYPAGAIAGIVVVTGGPDAEGGTQGLSDRHVAALQRLTVAAATDPVQAAARSDGPGP